MSAFVIYYKDGAKLMRPVKDETEYRLLRDAERNRTADKHHMVQMNYSCLPNENGALKGATRLSRSVGMDIDFDPKAPDYEAKMAQVPELVMGKKEELGLLMLERSANKGFHIVFRRRPGLSQEENLKWASRLLGVEYDKGAKDITRVFFTPPTDRLLYLDKELFDNGEAEVTEELKQGGAEASQASGQALQASAEGSQVSQASAQPSAQGSQATAGEAYLGIPYALIIDRWWAMYNDGQTPVRSNRNTLTFELAVNLRHICGFDRKVLDRVIPCYDGFPEAEKLACIDSALAEKRTQMPKRLKDVLLAVRQERMGQAEGGDGMDGLDEALAQDDLFYYKQLPTLPMGVKDSVDAVGPPLALPVLTAVTPVIGMLATGVRVDIHGKKSGLNLIAYIAGDFASGKGSIDPVVDAWTAEVKAMDKMYQQKEDEWRKRKRAAKNKKEQPEEPKLPVRCLTLNNTVANLAERLANTGGKHAFSFTPEADTVAQKWRSAMSDFSVMLRQAYDGTSYEREARSAEAVNVHIDRLLWNVVMCGTPDALYRVVTNYTDGFQSRIALARTPDNTYTALTDNLHVLTDRQRERIGHVAHLLPLLEGEVTLPKLEAKGRAWLERVRLETMKNDDKIKARQRFRICPTTMRMMTCIMLCRVVAALIDKHGVAGAETRLKQEPGLWREMILKQQTPAMLSAFDVLADYQMDNALFFFRERIEAAFMASSYAGQAASERSKRGRNDSIFERLDRTFSFEQALQQSIAVKGPNTSRNAVKQMLKNWRNQGLVTRGEDMRFVKR
ncbi:MAG: YfjI family protein [Prevotella sp.]|nr:YfjI family protein [Prevotella sp.]